MNGADLAKKVIAKYGTTDVFELAARAKVVIFFQKWYPVSYGEFDTKTQNIYINLNAPVPKKVILAHELGHFFVQQYAIQVNRLEEEKIVQAFAETLLG